MKLSIKTPKVFPKTSGKPVSMGVHERDKREVPEAEGQKQLKKAAFIRSEEAFPEVSNLKGSGCCSNVCRVAGTGPGVETGQGQGENPGRSLCRRQAVYPVKAGKRTLLTVKNHTT